MKLLFMPEAEEALFEIGLWVESLNTEESGVRFINKFIDKIAAFALPHVSYALCNNKILAQSQFQCVTINNWVIVFKQTKQAFIVHFILNAAGLK